jgi:polycomb protein EED
VGGRRATVFELDEQANIQVVHVFVDEDAEEDYFACAWAGRALCVAGHRGIIKILDVETGSLKAYLVGHGGPVYELQVSPADANLLFSCSKDESVGLWSLSSLKRVVVFAGDQGHRDAVLSIDVTDEWLLSGGMDNTVRLWHIADERIARAVQDCDTDAEFRAIFVQFPQFCTRRVHTDYLDCVRFVGQLIASKSVEGRISLWRPDKRRRSDAVLSLAECEFEDCGLWFVRFGLDYKCELVAVGGKDGVIHLFDVDRGGLPLASLKHVKLRRTVRQVGFSFDGLMLVAIEDGGGVWSWKR